MGTYAVGITGASGMAYAKRVLEGLLEAGHDVAAVITDAGRRVMALETDLALPGVTEADERFLRDWVGAGAKPGELRLRAVDDVGAPMASGSSHLDGMVVVPCSCGTLARIATGVSGNLIERAADVALKERRLLVLVPRETPLSLIHLRNMTAVTEAGAIVLPASPGFYHHPASIQDLVDAIAGRVLQHLGVETKLVDEWQGLGPAELANLEEL